MQVNYVKHPIYGRNPISSGENFSKADVLAAHWRYSDFKVFVLTAITADISKQNYSVYPRKIYVDIEEVCRGCGRNFIFFAREQLFWFERLGFYIDAHCIHCPKCRKKLQNTKNLQKRYQKLVEIENRTANESKALKRVAMELFQLGFIKDEGLLRINIGS